VDLLEYMRSQNNMTQAAVGAARTSARRESGSEACPVKLGRPRQCVVSCWW